MASDNKIAQVGITATGTIKNDKIAGTSRNDVLDGGAGSDEVNAGSGNDTLIYTMAQNAGARDRYDGGSDTDTLRLNFTATEWASASVRADVSRYLAFLAPVVGAKGEHEKGDAERGEGWFSFKAFGLEVRNVENLQVYVNGVLIDPTAVSTPNHAPVVTNAAAALVGSVIEDVALTAIGQLSASDVDAGTTLAWSVQGAAVGAYGSLAIHSATGQWTYTLNNSDAAVQALAAGETHTENFTVRVTDDRGASVDQVVVVTVNGTNDAPVITSGATVSAAENTSRTVYIATASDPDSSGVVYSLGGTDAALFEIVNTADGRGIVSFRTAPDFEAPTDADENNVYDITVGASDGLNTATVQPVAITVTDIAGKDDRSVIDLGIYGQLIRPIQVDGGQWFYYWDRNSDGLDNGVSGTQNTTNGVDYVTHDVLDSIFREDINGAVEDATNAVGIIGETDATFRYATLNGVHLALPTVGGADPQAIYGPNGVNAYQPGTGVGTPLGSQGIADNVVNATYNDYLAIWDALNGTAIGGAHTFAALWLTSPWVSSDFWSASDIGDNHAMVSISVGHVGILSDATNGYVGLQVL